jgi:exodeoxyribonuclease V alpha subunit
VLADIIASDAVPVVRLTEMFHQAAQSRIVVNAHRINQGQMPETGTEPTSDFHLVRCRDAEDGAARRHPKPVSVLSSLLRSAQAPSASLFLS